MREKAMIVDDDRIVLHYLETMIDWPVLGLDLVGAFTRAPDALERARLTVPDLAIVDISMPAMNGLELIRALTEINRHIVCIILSCHDEFHYAQQAVKLGVFDYILKESMDSGKVESVLKQAKRKLDQERQARQHYEQLDQLVSINQTAMKERWLRSWMNHPILNETEWIEQMAGYGMELQGGALIPAVCSLQRYNELLDRFGSEDIITFALQNVADEWFRDNRRILCFPFNGKEFILFYACGRGIKTNPYDEITELCNGWQRKLEQLLRLRTSVIIGRICESPSKVKGQLSTLLEQVDDLFYEPQRRLFKTGEIAALAPVGNIFERYGDFLERFRQWSAEGCDDVQRLTSEFMDWILASRFPPKDVRQFALKYALDIQHRLQYQPSFAVERLQRVLANVTKAEELEDWLRQFLIRSAGALQQVMGKSKKNEIVEAQKYVRAHLHKRISLEEISDHLHLNPSYFSRLFKKETGETFVEFVTGEKMACAKEMLQDSGRTVEEVALALGYENKSYFVKLFRMHYGMTPGEYL